MIPQRTLDQAIRCTGIGLHTGQKVEIDMLPDGMLMVRAKHTGTMSDLMGCLSHAGDPILSIDETSDATEKA